MTQKKKIKINNLHPQHPYKVEYEKMIQRSGRDRVMRDFKNGTHTYSIALLAGLSAVGLIMFLPPLSHSKPLMVTNPTPDSSLVGDQLNGAGGPEVAPSRFASPLDEAIQGQFDNSYAPLALAPIEQTLFVTVTRIYNHLKVANTVMPTTSAQTSSEYGWRTPPCDGCSADHRGVDFVPGYGEPIFAVADGMVIEMGSNGGYGNYVKLKHLIANTKGVVEEWETLYAHIKDDSFPKGMMIGSVVKSGDTIGAVGNTGMSTGPHLHFELLINGENVDPLPLLGTHKVIIVSEEDYPDYMFVGETVRRVETEVRYE
jgi:murein DD-endopeptidase MepM/ murein hydrolase activator NlpD